MATQLSSRQRLVRASFLVTVVMGLVWGTVWGRDHHFPFGPFSMYSGSTRDYIYELEFHAVTVEGDAIKLPASAFGLRRSEFDRQRKKFLAQPELMEAVVASYETVRPDGPELVQLDIVFVIYELIDDRPVFDQNRILATWQR